MSRKLAEKYIAELYDGPCIAVFHANDHRYQIWQQLLQGDAQMSIIESSHLGLFLVPARDQWMDLFAKAIGDSSKII
jgi:hypothetical protein